MSTLLENKCSLPPVACCRKLLLRGNRMYCGFIILNRSVVSVMHCSFCGFFQIQLHIHRRRKLVRLDPSDITKSMDFMRRVSTGKWKSTWIQLLRQLKQPWISVLSPGTTQHCSNTEVELDWFLQIGKVNANRLSSTKNTVRWMLRPWLVEKTFSQQ